MALFDAIGIAGTGVTVHRKWLDAVSDNIANLNNASPTSGEGRLVYEPNHPLADEQGNVRYPNIDLSSQMSQLIMAQRGYQVNLAVVDRAKVAYEAALQLGRN